MAASEHYFTQAPASDADMRTLEVDLAGRPARVHVARGVFSPDGIDKGTRVLLREAPPPPPSGTFLDLGCGWGPIALSLARLSPQATVFAIDVNERAVDLTRRNARALDVAGIRACAPAEVPTTTRFDLIWSNPPIRVGKEALHDLLVQWLPRLAPGGVAYLVVAKNLGADSLQRWLAEALPKLSVTRPVTRGGFRLLAVRRAVDITASR